MAQRMYCYFELADRQHRFVSIRGCQKALFKMQTAVNYFTSRDGPIYMTALDASEALYRVNYYGLFCKSIGLGIPLYQLNIVIHWRLSLKGQIKWH